MLIAPEDPGPDTLKFFVLRVFDGDGFLCRIPVPGREAFIEATLRCGFIDAPETGQAGGLEAKAFLESLIGDQPLDVIVLTKMDTGNIFDRHGRIVGVPFLPASASRPSGLPARNVELEMVLNGWAWVLERYGPDERYMAALEEAQRNRRGIWALDSNIPPWEFKRKAYAARNARPARAPAIGDLFTVRDAHPCPIAACDGVLVQRSGKFGRFWGCTRFPECRYSVR